MARPLQVYLDSSDFSNLANPNASDAYRSVEHDLVAWLDAGVIEIRFSHLHVVEASPVRPEDIPSSAARMAKIRQLCGQKCIRSTISILEKEVSTPGAWWTPDYFDWLFPNDGNWFPDVDDVATDLSPRTMLRRELLLTGLDRAARRRYERQWIDSRGNIKVAGKAYLRQIQPATIEQMQQTFPLQADATWEISNLIIDGADGATIRSKLLKAMSQDISLWPAWYEKHWDRVAPISALLRSGGSSINDGFAHALDVVSQEYAQWQSKGYPTTELDKIVERAFDKAASQMQANIVCRLAREMGVTLHGDSDGGDAWQLRPGLTTALSVQRQTFRRVIGLAGRPRKPGDGDFGDVLHCVHLPFVDFFRADGFAASMIAEVKLPFSTKIVPKLAQLPDLIRARLNRDEQ